MEKIVESSERPPESRDMIHSEPIEDRDVLESKTATALAAVFGDEGPDVEATPAPAKETAAVEEKVQEEPEAAAKAETGEAVEETPATEPAKAPTLPAAYVRSLKATGLTDDEIDAYSKTPDFLPIAAKIHATRNREVQEWAKAGREAKQQQSSQKLEEVKSPVALKPLDTEALRTKYGPELVDEIVPTLNATIAEINRILPAIQQTQQVSQQAQVETLGKQIESFFGEKELEPFKEVYGSVKNRLSQEQLDARNKVLELADALIAGARQQGRQLTLGEALTHAHDSVSSGFKEQAVRSTITKQLKQREKGISLKPGAIRKAPTTEVNTRKDLEKKVSQGLAAVFG